MNHPFRWLILGVAASLVAAKEAMLLMQHHQLQPPMPPERSLAVPTDQAAPQSIRMDRATQRLVGLAFATLQPRTHQPELRMYGLIVDEAMSDDQQGRRVSTTIRLVVPEATSLDPIPHTVSVEDANGQLVTAQLARVDGEGSGRSRTFWYRVDEQGIQWPPDLRVRLRVPIGPPLEGVLVPESAVVWRDGEAWVYVGRAADAGEASDASVEEFARRKIPVDAPVPGGWFVAGSLTADDSVVVEGAQLLLSTESQSDVPHGE